MCPSPASTSPLPGMATRKGPTWAPEVGPWEAPGVGSRKNMHRGPGLGSWYGPKKWGLSPGPSTPSLYPRESVPHHCHNTVRVPWSYLCRAHPVATTPTGSSSSSGSENVERRDMLDSECRERMEMAESERRGVLMGGCSMETGACQPGEGEAKPLCTPRATPS